MGVDEEPKKDEGMVLLFETLLIEVELRGEGEACMVLVDFMEWSGRRGGSIKPA